MKLKNYLKTHFALLIVLFFTSCTNIYKQIEREPILEKRSFPAISQPDHTPTANNPRLIKKKIKIAALLPFSGKHKNLGETMLNSMTLSIFENDPEGNIDLVLLDSNDMKNSAQEIINQKISVVLGPIFSENVKKLSSMLKGRDVTVISFSNNQSLVGTEGFFLMGFSPEQEIERIIDYTISSGDDNFAIVVPFNDYGRKFSSLFTAFVKNKGGNIISSKLYLNNTHLEKSVKEILNTFIISPEATEKNKEDITDEDKFYANVIFIPESGKKLTKISNLIKKHNKEEREIQIIGSSSWNNISTLNNPGLVGAWFASTSPDKYRNFEKRYYQIYKKFPPKVSSLGFDAIFAVSSTILASKNRVLSKYDFTNYASENNGFRGLDGLFRFLSNGLVQRNLAILEVQNGEFTIIDQPAQQFFQY